MYSSSAPLGPRCSLWLFSASSVLNSEKRNTEDAKNHREPQRNQPFPFHHVLIVCSIRPSVLSVAFLRVLCVKFRKAQRKCARHANISTPSSPEKSWWAALLAAIPHAKWQECRDSLAVRRVSWAKPCG